MTTLLVLGASSGVSGGRRAQVRMAQDLRVVHYRDGRPIRLVADSAEWRNLTAGAYSLLGGESTEARVAYGLLYNFQAAADRSGLCPEVWHVPRGEEWRVLIERLGGNDIAGSRMKDTTPDTWKHVVPGTSNASGSSALPAGGRGRYGSPADLGYYATWWSSTSYDPEYAWHWGLHPDRHDIRSNPGHNAHDGAYAFALVALFLSARGLHGVLAFHVVRRTHEIGVRMAMGASAPRMMGAIGRQGMILAAVGLTLGLGVRPS